MLCIRWCRPSAWLVVVAISPLAAAQTQWKFVAGMPPGRHDHAVAYDAGRQRIVMFGGSSDTGLLDETWQWNGTWKQQYPQVSPPPRHQHAMAYDARRGNIVVFGGIGTGPPLRALGDTWLWNGNTWTQVTPPQSPPPRWRAAMSFDPIRGRLVLYGGTDLGVSKYYYDTWEWDGSTWTDVTPAGGPTLLDKLMVTDYSVARPVLLSPGAGQSWGQVWEWIGGKWNRMPNSNLPSTTRRTFAACAYDVLRRRIVLFGGMLNDDHFKPTSETWEWDRVQWTLRSPANPASACYSQAMAYDPVADEIVMCGGRVQAYRLNETWTYATVNKAAYEPFGAGCRGSAGTARLSLGGGWPWIGDSAVLEVTSIPAQGAVALVLGASRTQWGSLRLPFDLGTIGMPGCSLFTSVDVPVPIANSNGTASLPVVFCNCPPLVGLDVFQQAFVQDAVANRLGWVVSNAARMRIGAR